MPSCPATLKNGEAFKQVYGDKVGYRYYEDRGMFCRTTLT
jgi:hypothetical protein